MVQEDLSEITTEFLDQQKTISSETGIFWPLNYLLILKQILN